MAAIARFEDLEIWKFAKGSNGKVRSPWYRAFDRNLISKETLEVRPSHPVAFGNKIKAFINYLAASPCKTKPRKS